MPGEPDWREAAVVEALGGLPEREGYLRKLLSLPPLAERFASEREMEQAASRLAEGSEGLAPAHLKEAVLSAALASSRGVASREGASRSACTCR